MGKIEEGIEGEVGREDWRVWGGEFGGQHAG